MKQALLMNEKLIQVCYNDWVDEHFEVNESKISYKEDIMLVILEIESQNTPLSVIHIKEIKFREANNMMK